MINGTAKSTGRGIKQRNFKDVGFNFYRGNYGLFSGGAGLCQELRKIKEINNESRINYRANHSSFADDLSRLRAAETGKILI
jgi:hypothetical protein